MNIEWWRSKKNGRYYTRIVGFNGEGIYTSQGYTSKTSAIRSSNRVRDSLKDAKTRKRKFK